MASAGHAPPRPPSPKTEPRQPPPARWKRKLWVALVGAVAAGGLKLSCGGFNVVSGDNNRVNSPDNSKHYSFNFLAPLLQWLSPKPAEPRTEAPKPQEPKPRTEPTLTPMPEPTPAPTPRTVTPPPTLRRPAATSAPHAHEAAVAASKEPSIPGPSASPAASPAPLHRVELDGGSNPSPSGKVYNEEGQDRVELRANAVAAATVGAAVNEEAGKWVVVEPDCGTITADNVYEPPPVPKAGCTMRMLVPDDDGGFRYDVRPVPASPSG